MPRANAMVPPDAIRIEDEVWQEAFTRREPARTNRRQSLRALDGGQAEWLTVDRVPTTSRESSVSSEPTAHLPQPATAAGAITASTSARPAAATAVSTRAAATLPAGWTATPLPTDRATSTPAPSRRTVKIQGRGAERNLPWPETTRRRPPRRAYERAGFRPDRLAMWAVMLGLLLVLVAVISGHG
jgi:hypothetical protein